MAHTRRKEREPSDDRPRPCAIIVTARDEATRIAETVAALVRTFPRARVIVADDGSSDGTAEVATSAGAEVVELGRRVGKGGAASAAAARLMEHSLDDRDIVLLCDADLGESAARLDRVVAAVGRGDADLAVARFSVRRGGGLGVAVGFARLVLRRFTGVTLAAPISGQRALTVEALRACLPFGHGFGMELAMSIDAHRSRFRIAEVEVDLEHRATGRDLRGFLHRGRQLAAFARVALGRAVRRRRAGSHTMDSL